MEQQNIEKTTKRDKKRMKFNGKNKNYSKNYGDGSRKTKTAPYKRQHHTFDEFLDEENN